MNIGFNFVVGAGRNSGAKEYLVNLFEALATGGHDERYVLYCAREETDETLHRFTALSPNVRAVRTPIPMFPTYERVLRGHGYWRRRLERDGIDVFHHTYFPLPAGVENVAGTVQTLHDLIQRGMPKAFTAPRRWFTNLVQPGALRRADVIAVVSNDVKQDVRRFHPELDPDKVEVIPNAVGSSYLERGERGHQPDEQARVRARYGLPARYVLGVGHLEPRKNWDRLIQAYSGLYQRYGDEIPSLVIVGSENWNFEGIYDAAGATGVRDRVVFTGFVDEEDLPEVYANALVFAYPSLYEGFGIPVLEAMACNTAVLTSNVTSLPEIAGGAAHLVDPYDVDAIADGLLRLIRDESFRQELVRRGRKNVRRYGWSRSADSLRDIYYRLAGERRPATRGAAR